MARPQKADADRLGHVVAFRVSAKQAARLARDAAAAGLKPPEYARMATLGRPLAARLPAPAIPPNTIPFAVADQLRRIGVNLNQIARLSHMGVEHETALLDLMTEIREMLTEIHRAAGEADRLRARR